MMNALLGLGIGWSIHKSRKHPGREYPENEIECGIKLDMDGSSFKSNTDNTWINDENIDIIASRNQICDQKRCWD